MTPYELRVLLHYYAHVDDPPQVADNPPVWSETRDRFLSEDLIRTAVGDERRYGASWMLTERGRAFCDALQIVPLPDRVWVVRFPNTATV